MVAADADASPPCDFCGETTAVVYCRADSSRLCLACDREVHAANTVSSRHHRSLLCDLCAAASAVIFCSSPPHRLALCSNCDFDAHRAADHRHDRRAVEPFTGCPAGAELAAAIGIEDVKGVFSGEANGGGGVQEGWAWDAPPVFSWDDLFLPLTTTPFHGFQALGTHPPPKDRNSSCGKRKEEIHQQLREIIKGEIDGVKSEEEIEPELELASVPLENFHGGKLGSNYDYNPVFVDVRSCEASNLQWNQNDNLDAGNLTEISSEQQIRSSSLLNPTILDFSVEAAAPASLNGGSDKDSTNPTSFDDPTSALHKAALELPDRSSVISRYKEKRKTRRYDKLIRYESRKARADNRVRIKGRFAKANQVGKLDGNCLNQTQSSMESKNG
ncbi:Zinc finger protein CONSTANS-LIKE 13 [Apostasia shenzhenica]|uniref:Zinc finger protein CONSTANS-LIKE 13 n=1 Tax=Apostasia shenzhenica TaxID=1088818 RepID=A0A2I0AQ10_9ASPA|nr:Zinc finger protein CONSTANS-LIKE 13 [Apostasia shenzhenica]